MLVKRLKTRGREVQQQANTQKTRWLGIVIYPVDSAIQLLNNRGREYSSSPWTNLSTLQGMGRGGGGGIAKLSCIPFYKKKNDGESFMSFPGA